MRKRRSPAAGDEHELTPPVPAALRFDAESLAAIALRIKAAGFVPLSVLREEFGDEKVTQAIAVLFRDFRVLREARRPWTDGKEHLGYELADERHSKSWAKKIPPELGFLIDFVKDKVPRYKDYVRVEVTCRWTTPVLGSVPIKDAGGDLNVFERDHQGNLLILPYHQRAMLTVALPMIGKEAAIAKRTYFSTIRIPSTTPVKIVQHGIAQIHGQGGIGLRRSECIMDGLTFKIVAQVPTSMLPVDEYLRALQVAGEFSRLSPGRSAGFGAFEVLRAD